MRLRTVWWRFRVAAMALVASLAIVVVLVWWINAPPEGPAWLRPGVAAMPGGDANEPLRAAALTLDKARPARAELHRSPNQLSPAETAAALDAHLEAAAPALAELGAVVGQTPGPVGEPDGDPSALDLPGTNRVRAAGQTAQFAAVRAAELGETAAAARFARVSAAIPRAYGPPTNSVGGLVRCTLVGQAVTTAERVLALTELTDAELAKLQADFAALYATNLTEQMLLSERAWGLAALERQSNANPGLLALGLRGQSVGQMPLFTEAGGRTLAACRLPLAGQWAAVRAGKSHADPLTMVESLAAAALRARGEAGMAVAAIACERYRHSRGDWPTSLAAIPGDLLAEVPIDPFTGKSLELERTSLNSFALSFGGPKPVQFSLYSPTMRAR